MSQQLIHQVFKVKTLSVYIILQILDLQLLPSLRKAYCLIPKICITWIYLLLVGYHLLVQVLHHLFQTRQLIRKYLSIKLKILSTIFYFCIFQISNNISVLEQNKNCFSSEIALSSHSNICLFQNTSEGNINYFINISYNSQSWHTLTQYVCVYLFKITL